MKRNSLLVLTAAPILPGIAAFPANVRTDYDHSANFALQNRFVGCGLYNQPAQRGA